MKRLIINAGHLDFFGIKRYVLLYCNFRCNLKYCVVYNDIECNSAWTPNPLRSGTVHYILCVREHFYVLSYFGNIP